jgi:23S rRNA pseudouridine1911/1915/1917 synthase
MNEKELAMTLNNNQEMMHEIEDGDFEQGTLERFEWTLEAGNRGIRIDKFISEQLGEEISRSQIQNWIKEARVTVNNSVVKANYKCAADDVVIVQIPEPVDTEIIPEAIALDVIYEDEDVIVVNKPRGMVVHPAPGHYTGTLVNALMHHCTNLSSINGVVRPGIVHRIDKDTSGLIMAAKNDRAHQSLSKQLKDHTVTRKYTALVHGNITHDQGTIDAPIGRGSQDRKMFVVTDKNSKHAVTHFAVLERLQKGNYTLVELKLETGRTHQIRVHMKYIEHPLVGDPLYGRNKGIQMDGQALHAAILGFEHPTTGKYMEFTTDIPGDMQHIIDVLRGS